MEVILPKHKSNPIKVIGVGGGGGNAVNYMHSLGIKDVDFAVCNTDVQDLEKSPVENKIQLGVELTKGLGAGADPEIGAEAAKESIEAIEDFFEKKTEMVFITAGMGGGTGTGAAPIIAKIAKDKGILTVAIVTTPMNNEGPLRERHAKKGLENLIPNVDSILIIDNNKFIDIYGGDLSVRESFQKADEVLSNSAKGMAEIITKTFLVNIDLADARKILANSGKTIMGKSISSGEERALKSIESAINQPILVNNNIEGATKILLLITYSSIKEVTNNEQNTIINYIKNVTKEEHPDIILGLGSDEDLKKDEISITIVATGFSENNKLSKKIETTKNKEVIKKIDTKNKEIINLDEGRK